MNVYFSHGVKGGVGKSMVSLVVVDYLLSLGRKVGVIEVDCSTPDVILKLRTVKDVSTAIVDVSENAYDGISLLVSSFITFMEEGVTDVVVNLPAGATQIDGFASEIKQALDSLEVNMKVYFSVGDSSSDTISFNASARDGLVAVAGTENTLILFPIFLLNPPRKPNIKALVEKFDISQYMEDELSAYAFAVMPALPSVVSNKVKSLPGLLSSYIEVSKDNPIGLLDAMTLKTFLLESRAIVGHLIDKEDVA